MNQNLRDVETLTSNLKNAKKELSPYFQGLSTSLHQTPPEHVAEVQMNWKLEPSQSKHIVGIGFKIVLYVFNMEILTILWTAITSSYDEKQHLRSIIGLISRQSSRGK